MKESYPSQVTDESRKELLAIARWYNDIYGHNVTVVGGWAAHLYHKGLGSRDIDLVFLHNVTLHESLETYMKSNGYTLEKDGNSEWSFVKHVAGTEVIVDAVDSAARRQVTGTKASVIWKWTQNEEHVDRHTLENGAEIFVPKPELLLYYKFGGMLGRSNALRTTLDPAETAMRMSKVQKDIYDAGLVAKESGYVDIEKLWLFMKASGLTEYIHETIVLLNEHGINEEVGSLIPSLTSILEDVVSREANFDALSEDLVSKDGNGIILTLPSYRTDFPEIYHGTIDMMMKQLKTSVEPRRIATYLSYAKVMVGDSKELGEYTRRHYLAQIKSLSESKNPSIKEIAKKLRDDLMRSERTEA